MVPLVLFGPWLFVCLSGVWTLSVWILSVWALFGWILPVEILTCLSGPCLSGPFWGPVCLGPSKVFFESFFKVSMRGACKHFLCGFPKCCNGLRACLQFRVMPSKVCVNCYSFVNESAMF